MAATDSQGNVKFKAVTFVKNGDVANGYYFYDSGSDSDGEKIFGVVGLTLPKAIAIMKAKGIDVINDKKYFNYNIAVYYHY